MKIEDALEGISSIFLDTAPVIYFVEKHPQYGTVTGGVFNLIDGGSLSAVTSPITLAECLIVPIREGQADLRRDYNDLIVRGINTRFVDVNEEAGVLAAELRARYNLRLIDVLQLGTAITSGCDAFLTNDALLRRVTEIKVIMIDDLEL